MSFWYFTRRLLCHSLHRSELCWAVAFRPKHCCSKRT